MTTVRFDPESPGWLAEPYDSYTELRSKEPVHWSNGLNHWVLTRYADVVAVLKDPRFTATNRMPQRRRDRPTMMVTADPPHHGRLRSPVTNHFTFWSVDEWRPRMQEVVDELLTAVEPRSTMDIVTELARPLPLTIISEMLGLPMPAGTPASSGYSGAGRGLMATAVVMPGQQFFLDALQQQRDEPDGGPLSDLVAAEAAGKLTAEEVLDTVVILYSAGQETTAKMISNAVYYLLKHPDRLRELREQPSLIASATDELLRFDGPVHAISRKAKEDVELGGRTIRRGQKVLCVLAAANRDPERFSHADDLALERPDNQHIQFGTGIHACLGAMLARAEIEIAVGTLLRRFPGMRLATDDVAWEGSFILRGLPALPVELS